MEGQEKALDNIGIIYKEQGAYEASLEYHLQKLALTQRLNSLEGEAAALSNLGNTYVCMGQYQQAIECQRKSLEIASKIGDRWTYGIATYNLGDAFRLMKKFSKALSSLLESLYIFDMLQVPQTVTAMEVLTQIALEIGLDDYTELLEMELQNIEAEQGREVVASLRKYLFEE